MVKWLACLAATGWQTHGDQDDWFGWVSPSSGDVIFNGESINGVGADQICRRGIGLVLEDRRIFPGLTVEENLHLGQMQCPLRSRLDARRRMEEIYQ